MKKPIKGMRKLSYKEILAMLRQEFDTRVGLQTRKDDLLEFCKTLYEILKKTQENTGSSSYGDTFYIMYDKEITIGEKLEKLINPKLQK